MLFFLLPRDLTKTNYLTSTCFSKDAEASEITKFFFSEITNVN